MENNLLSPPLLLLIIFQFSSLPRFISSAYTLPEHYFINCGSQSNTTVNGRNFVGDVNSNSSSFAAGQSSAVTNPSTPTSPLYQTARVFTNPSWYELDIVQPGTYMVRLHFYPFPSPNNTHFDVSASGVSLLSNLSVENVEYNLPLIEEFLLNINVGKFRIQFTPCSGGGGGSSFAFVNAIEAFITPQNFIPNSTTHITASQSNNYTELLSNVFHTIHRINVGGPTITPNNDSLWRSWVNDDVYLYFKDVAQNSETFRDALKYEDGGANVYTAPDLVYKTAKELKIDIESQHNFFNMTWRFNVTRNSTHLVRVHFCDILSPSLGITNFNFYIYSQFSELIHNPQLATPFYYDFAVDSDDSGFISFSIGPRVDLPNQTAFLNGLEIMELLKKKGGKAKMKHMFLIIIGAICVGVGVAFAFIAVLAFILYLKCRKAKAVDNSEWPLVPLYVGSEHSMVTERTTNGSNISNLNLCLKLPFAEILYATNNFDPKLMIGEGGFGKVYKGTLQSGTIVAVKRSKPGHGQGLQEFQTEIKLLSKIRHRHLVSLIGYCDDRSEMILVYEFMEKGTLREHLYNSNEDSSLSETKRLSWNQRLEICIGAAKGLHHLHTGSNLGIIHRDVKSTNILLDGHFVAKVADFGLSRSGPPDETHVITEVKGSFGYLDPEYFRCLELTQKSDVYSFGVVLLEVLCARPAINNLLPRDQVNLADWGVSWQKKGQLGKIIDPSLEGEINPNSLRKFGETVESCLKEFGVDRPSMIDVTWDLEYALQFQRTALNREPHEDSSTDPSLVLPLPAVHRLPSDSIPFDEDEYSQVVVSDCSDTIYRNESEVFSQLRVGDAR